MANGRNTTLEGVVFFHDSDSNETDSRVIDDKLKSYSAVCRQISNYTDIEMRLCKLMRVMLSMRSSLCI